VTIAPFTWEKREPAQNRVGRRDHRVEHARDEGFVEMRVHRDFRQTGGAARVKVRADVGGENAALRPECRRFGRQRSVKVEDLHILAVGP
jgi:hypothetical protein